MSQDHDDLPAPAATGEQTRFEGLALLRHPVWVFDIDRGRVHWANKAALEQVWSAPSLAELQARDMARDMSPAVAARLAQYQSDFISRDAVFNDHWTLYPKGEPVILDVTHSRYPLPDGRTAMLCEGRPASVGGTPEALRSVEALMHTAVMITLYAQQGMALYRNPAARGAVRDPSESWGQRCCDADELGLLLAEVERSGSAIRTLAVKTARGRRWHEVHARRCRDAVTGAEAILVSEVDVTARVESEARARHLAIHDPLTGLANRAQVRERFGQAVADLEAAGRQAALILIDLDHFKDVNDTLGHDAGDRLLIEVAGRLRGAVRREDLVARFGGDEFLVLVISDDIVTDVERVHARISATMRSAIEIDGKLMRIGTTLGVSLFPRDGRDFRSLLRNADVAMYQAKRAGRGQIAFYTAQMGKSLRERTQLEQEIRQALAARQFEVHYQPRLRLDGARIVGAEALVRWRHPTRGLIMPSDFIPLCEAMRVVDRLGQQVFEQAARQQAQWAAHGLDLVVSINLSALEFSDPRLPQRLGQTLNRAGCRPGAIQVEITESMLLEPADGSPLNTLLALRDAGISIALDDFGTGYSNLAALQRFPISVLKIDRSFMQDLDREKPLARMIVDLCRLMQLEAVAEGVETSTQYEWVRAAGIEELQGWLVSPAIAPARLAQLVRAYEVRPNPPRTVGPVRRH